MLKDKRKEWHGRFVVIYGRNTFWQLISINWKDAPWMSFTTPCRVLTKYGAERKKKKSRFQVESTWLLSITACSSHDRSVDVRYDNVTGNPPQKTTNFFFFFLKLNYNFASLSFLFLARGKITWSVFFRCSIADGGNVLHHSVDLFNQQKKNKKKVTKNMLWDQESVFY